MIILINGYICEGSSDSFTYPYSFSLIYYVIRISGELSFHLLYTSFKACMIIFMKGDMCEVSSDPFNCPYSFSLIFLNIILEQDMVMFYTFWIYYVVTYLRLRMSWFTFLRENNRWIKFMYLFLALFELFSSISPHTY